MSYFYDCAGDLIMIRDGSSNQLTATYDDLRRKTSMAAPDRGTWNFRWDGLSRLRRQTDARQVLTAFEYDAIGRLERRFMKRQADPVALLDPPPVWWTPRRRINAPGNVHVPT